MILGTQVSFSFLMYLARSNVSSLIKVSNLCCFPLALRVAIFTFRFENLLAILLKRTNGVSLNIYVYYFVDRQLSVPNSPIKPFNSYNHIIGNRIT
jgi:hypothetical protein